MIDLSKLSANLMDLIHFMFLFFPIVIYFHRFPIYIVQFMLLFSACVPLSWEFFNNKCFLTIISKNLRGDEEKSYNFSERYLSPLYKTIIKIFHLTDDEIGFNQAINIHLMINIMLLWYYLFYY